MMGPNEIRVLSESQVDDILNRLSADEILRCVGRALHAFSEANTSPTRTTETERSQYTADVQNPRRLNVTTPHHNVLFMPSRAVSNTSIKVVSVPRSSQDTSGLPAATMVINEHTGRTKALINARSLTAVRTAAASVLALRLSPDVRNAKKMLIFGTGLQALWHARLICTLLSSLEEIVIAYRSHNLRAQATVRAVSELPTFSSATVRGCLIEEAVSKHGAVEDADVICCCTPSTEYLFSATRVKQGCCITMIGSYKPHMREVDLAALFAGNDGTDRKTDGPQAQRVIVDSRDACISEAGEIYDLRASHPQLFAPDKLGTTLVELGELLDENGCGRESCGSKQDYVTVFKSVGVGVMDSAISALILAKAEQLNLGSLVDF